MYNRQQMMEGGRRDQQRKQWRDSKRGLGGGGGGGGRIKTDRDGERMCEEVCVSEGASVCVKAKQSVAVAEAVQQQQ